MAASERPGTYWLVIAAIIVGDDWIAVRCM